MISEQPYDFRKRHHEIHHPDRRNPQRTAGIGETEITSEWVIRIPGDADPVLRRAAADLQSYLFISMGLSLPLVCLPGQQNAVSLELQPETDGFLSEVRKKSIRIFLHSPKEAFPAVVYLEDCMDLESAPVLSRGRKHIRNNIRIRAVHSGCGIDDYPDDELLATVHAGYNTIVLFLHDLDKTGFGFQDINELADRAEKYGLNLLFYNKIPSFKHPDDDDAEEFFDRIYGELFRRHPKAIGMMLCGESLEFPSKDPHSTGRRWRDSITDGIPDSRPSPGWYPCRDYPAYLSCIERAVHKVSPDASIYFNTTNWGYQPAALRREFLRHFPPRVKLTVTYEIFKNRSIEDLACPFMDYTIVSPDPGEYFLTEARAAHAAGIEMFLVTNTAGTTWDFGTIPYVPVPWLWIRRLEQLEQIRKKLGIRKWYECHHYGWQNCVVTDLAKWSTRDPRNFNPKALLKKIAVRDYGENCALAVTETWKQWSDALKYYVTSNEDQYGPGRVGPAYPFIFHPHFSRTLGSKEIQFPAAPEAYFGGAIVKTFYHPFENYNQSPGHLRYPAEIRSLKKMLTGWNRGLALLENVRPEAAPIHLPALDRMTALGIFIRNTVITMIHIKQWWRLNIAMLNAPDRASTGKILARIKKLAEAEMENTRDTLPAVDMDSRLGWEPSMGYVADRPHLEWKLRQMEHTLDEITTFEHILRLHP